MNENTVVKKTETLALLQELTRLVQSDSITVTEFDWELQNGIVERTYGDPLFKEFRFTGDKSIIMKLGLKKDAVI